MSHKGNRGEWSELYVFLKILCERRVSSADENLQPIPDKLYPVKKIIRAREGTYEFLPDSEDAILIDETGEKKTIDTTKVYSLLPDLKQAIEQIESGGGAAELQVGNELMELAFCKGITANPGGKSDIVLEIFDIDNGIETRVGFSIKSQLGGDPTLLNAGKTTNFEYDVELPASISALEIEELKKLKAKTLVKKILETGGELQFKDICNETLKRNLLVIDSLMPQIVAELLIANFSSTGKGIGELTDVLIDKESLSTTFVTPPDKAMITKKIKDLLMASLLGMEPNTPWQGDLEAQGGCIIVLQDGIPVCYHYNDTNKLREYLFTNTRFETGSTTRHEFGKLIEKPSGGYGLKLNLQIRFK